MADISFPPSPINGEEITHEGKVWRYDATKLRWNVAATKPNVIVGPTQPSLIDEFVWFQTDGNGNLIDILIGKNT